MENWADYAISAVRFNDKHTHIAKVTFHKVIEDRLVNNFEYSREQVIADIKGGLIFATVFKSSDNEAWVQGQRVYVIKVNGTEYIKTIEDRTERDNLDKLPEF